MSLEDLIGARNELVRGMADLENRLAEIDRRIAEAEHPLASDADRRAPTPSSSSPRRTLRAKVLDALDDIRGPTYARQLGPYIEARFGTPVPPSRFGVLARDEQNAFRSKRHRPVYICFGLTSERGEPMKRFLARSDWPLELRIVAPTTGRVQHLAITARLCEIAQEIGPRAAEPDGLRYLIADHARDLPGVKVRRDRFELVRWREVAEAELERLAPRDRAEREKAAERLKHRPEFALLFGAPDAIDGSLA